MSPAESFRPVAGRDYPRDFNELVDWFSDEERCYGFLEGVRWREGFTCPHCGARELLAGESWSSAVHCVSQGHVGHGRDDP